MKKLTGRAISVVLIIALVLLGTGVYTARLLEKGSDWALYFSSANSGAGGELRDRHGELLASFDATKFAFSENAETRVACDHVTGDYWNRTGTGALGAYWDRMQEYSLIEGTNKK